MTSSTGADVIDEPINGVTLPAVGYGTRLQHGRACRDLVTAALAEGYRHLDTAPTYDNEDAVGEGIRRSPVPRDEILVTTKLRPEDADPARVPDALDLSLRRLQLDHVDFLLLHWPNRTIPIADTLAAMASLRDQGKVRMLGVANFPTALLDDAVAARDIVTNQVEYHPYLGQQKLLAATRSHGLVLTAYCPLGRGGTVLEDPSIRRIAADLDRTVGQVILRWLVQQPGVVTIPGTSDVGHLRENLAVRDFALDDDQMGVISALDRGDRVVDPPDRAPEWD